MTLYQTNFAKGVQPMPQPEGSELVSVRMEFSLSAALALNDVLDMGILPAMCVPVDWAIDTDDLDTNVSPTIKFDVGILNAGKTAISTATADGGAAWDTALTTPQAGGYVRNTKTPVTRVTSEEDTDRHVGILVSTGPATGAATGKVGLTLTYRAGFQGE